MSDTLFYVHDPMCSWCWGFRAAWDALQAQLPRQVSPVRLLGGLAPDSKAPMPTEMREHLQRTWHEVARCTGAEFNHDFWRTAKPVRSTWPACRAVIAARDLAAADENMDAKMTDAIQRAYYLHAKNPSEADTLTELAVALGIDAHRFERAMQSEATAHALRDEMQLARQLGVRGFPALVLLHKHDVRRVEVRYDDARGMLRAIENITRA